MPANPAFEYALKQVCTNQITLELCFYMFTNAGEPCDHKIAARGRANYKMATRTWRQPQNGKEVTTYSAQFIHHN